MRKNLDSERNYALLDDLRLLAAFFVVAIHVGPFSCISETLDYYLTYCIGRLGVPFFLMVTGYFVLSGYEKQTYSAKVWQTAGKLALIYLGVTILYLPLAWYAGNLPETPWAALKWFLFDGTFYHLWYLPAAIEGCLITAFLLLHLPPAVTGGITVFLYLAGVFGDSWYGLAEQVPLLHAFYETVFQVSSHTRNGIFLAPVFLWMGVVLADTDVPLSGKRSLCLAGFAASLCVMLAEGGITRYLGWQRHNSMYLFLVPAMLFGFSAIVGTPASVRKKKAQERTETDTEGQSGKREAQQKAALALGPVFLRKTAMWIYLLHPLCIVLVRGAAGMLKWEQFMVENTFVLYLEVSVMSFAAGVFCTFAEGTIRSRQRKGGSRYVQKGQGLD